MTFDVLSDVNWLAVIVAAAGYFVLGVAWYVPMGPRWSRAGGIEVPEDASPEPSVFVLTYVAYAVAGVATAMLAVATGTDTLGEGVVLGLVVGVGYALTAAGVSAVYDRKPEPLNWFWMNGVLNVIGLVVMGAIIGAWN
jgi:hypothetical protein